MSDEVRRLLRFLVNHKPFGLDKKLPYPLKQEDGSCVTKDMGWPDDHAFIVAVPAWVFREAQRLLDGA